MKNIHKGWALPMAVVFLGFSCSSNAIKEKINQTGDVAGQALGEFTSGVTTGVEKAIEPTITVNEPLKTKGISLGKTIVSGDTTTADNVLTVYLVFSADFSGSLMAKAFDNKGLEMGRAKVAVSGKKDDAQYIEFHFDKRTDIDNDSRLVIE